MDTAFNYNAGVSKQVFVEVKVSIIYIVRHFDKKIKIKKKKRLTETSLINWTRILPCPILTRWSDQDGWGPEV